MLPKIAILAGGKGTRLSAVTGGGPKVLTPICGVPFIRFVLELFKVQGFKRFVLCVGHGGAQVQAYVGSGQSWGIDVVYSYDLDNNVSGSVGTAHAILHALPMLDDSFLVANGDTLCFADAAKFSKAVASSHCSAAMIVYKNNNQCWPSNVRLMDDLKARYSKLRACHDSQHIDCGISLFSSELFLKNVEIADMSELVEKISSEGVLTGWEVSERFYEINTPASLQETYAFIECDPRAQTIFRRILISDNRQ